MPPTERTATNAGQRGSGSQGCGQCRAPSLICCPSSNRCQKHARHFLQLFPGACLEAPPDSGRLKKFPGRCTLRVDFIAVSGGKEIHSEGKEVYEKRPHFEEAHVRARGAR